MIIGIAAGASGLVVLAVTLCICRKIRNRADDHEAAYPADSSKEMIGDIEVEWTAADSGEWSD